VTTSILAYLVRNPWRVRIGVALLLVATIAPAQAATRSQAPNVVIILADDLGYGDPHCYNAQSRIDTPALDRLAAHGVRFTDAHSADAVCTPSRYGLLTGRYCWRTRLKRSVLDGYSPPLIEASRPTLASFLHGQGYATACFGKWHLGLQWTRRDGTLETRDRPANGFRTGEDIDVTKPVLGGPTAVGFDTFFGISGSLDMAPYCWIQDDHCVRPPTEKVPDAPDMFLNQAAGLRAPGFDAVAVLPTLETKSIQWITDHLHREPEKPFFVYLALNSPHLPVVPTAEFRGRSGAGRYGDYVMETDAVVGAVVEALERGGALENTIVVFSSDNGSLWHEWDPVEADDVAFHQPSPRGEYTRKFGHQANGPLRGTKADIWEGGHRVPLIVQWPARLAPGVAGAAVELTDLFATLADALSVPLPEDAAPDSFSFYSVLQKPALARSSRPFSVHHSIHGMFGISSDGWKYAEARGSGGFSTPKMVKPKPGEPTGQLYHISDDIAETKNLFSAEPGRVLRLQQQLDLAKRSPSLRHDARLASPKAGNAGRGEESGTPSGQ